MKTILKNGCASHYFRLQAGKFFAIATFSTGLVGLPWQTLTNAQSVTRCDYYGCYPVNRSSSSCGGRYSRAVLVEFVARGDDWGNVWLDSRNIFQPRNYNRRQTISLCPGAYRVIFAGNTKFDVWAAGYLDIGRTNIVRIAFSADGRVDVQGDPYAWLPDETIDSTDVWRR